MSISLGSALRFCASAAWFALIPGCGNEQGGLSSFDEPQYAATGSAAGDIVTTNGTHFMVGGKTFRFIGVNSAGLSHYGTSILPYATTGQISEQLRAAANMGAKVVRIFGAANNGTASEVANRLGYVLDQARANDLYVIVALTDYYNSTAYHPRGDDSFYSPAGGGWILLNESFFAGGFRTNYLPFVREVVTRYKDHPAVFAWELGNEIKHPPNPDVFQAFCKESANTIRSIDARHLITVGMISSRSGGMSSAQAEALYKLRNISFITTHNYDGDTAEDDTFLIPVVNKPLIIEEMGFSSGDRSSRVDANLRYWVDTKSARGYMQWGFLATGSDNGDGDRTYGLDKIFHKDWNALSSKFKEHANRLSGSVTPPPPPSGGTMSTARVDVRYPVASGLWITECVPDRSGQYAFQTGSSGKDGSSRWADFKWPEAVTGDCGTASGGLYPMIFKSSAAGTLRGTWVTQCLASGKTQHVYRVDTDVAGHPAAGYLYDETNTSCP